MDLISKYDIIEKIVTTNNETVLHQIKHLLDEQEIENWNDLSADLKKSIQKGIVQAKKGELTPHNKVIKEMRKKYLKK